MWKKQKKNKERNPEEVHIFVPTHTSMKILTLNTTVCVAVYRNGEAGKQNLMLQFGYLGYHGP